MIPLAYGSTRCAEVLRTVRGSGMLPQGWQDCAKGRCFFAPSLVRWHACSHVKASGHTRSLRVCATRTSHRLVFLGTPEVGVFFGCLYVPDRLCAQIAVQLTRTLLAPGRSTQFAEAPDGIPSGRLDVCGECLAVALKYDQGYC